MIILGIDPGLASVGYALIKVSKAFPAKLLEAGIISTSSKLQIAERLYIIRKDLSNLLESYSPDYIGVELLYFTKNVKTGIAVSQARGVILESIFAYNRELKIYEYTPTKVKHSLVGFGKAGKKELQKAVSRLLGLEIEIRPDDAADALALALMVTRELGLV